MPGTAATMVAATLRLTIMVATSISPQRGVVPGTTTTLEAATMLPTITIAASTMAQAVIILIQVGVVATSTMAQAVMILVLVDIVATSVATILVPIFTAVVTEAATGKVLAMSWTAIRNPLLPDHCHTGICKNRSSNLRHRVQPQHLLLRRQPYRIHQLPQREC